MIDPIARVSEFPQPRGLGLLWRQDEMKTLSLTGNVLRSPLICITKGQSWNDTSIPESPSTARELRIPILLGSKTASYQITELWVTRHCPRLPRSISFSLPILGRE